MATIKTYNKTVTQKAASTQKTGKNLVSYRGFQQWGVRRISIACCNLEKLLVKTDAKTKELISIAVSAANGCEYAQRTSRTAKGAGVDEEIPRPLKSAR